MWPPYQHGEKEGSHSFHLDCFTYVDSHIGPFTLSYVYIELDDMNRGGPLPLPDHAAVEFPAQMGDVKLRCELVLEPRFTRHHLIVSEVSHRVFHVERQYTWEDGTHSEEKARERVFPVERQPFHVTGLEIFRASATLALHGEWSITTRRVQGNGISVYVASVSADDQNRTYTFKSSIDMYNFQHTLLGQRLLARETDIKFAFGDSTADNGSLQLWKRPEYQNLALGGERVHIALFPEREDKDMYIVQGLRPDLKATVETPSQGHPHGRILYHRPKSTSLTEKLRRGSARDAPKLIHVGSSNNICFKYQDYKMSGPPTVSFQSTRLKQADELILSCGNIATTIALGLLLGAQLTRLQDLESDSMAIRAKRTSHEAVQVDHLTEAVVVTGQEESDPEHYDVPITFRRRNSTDTMSTMSIPAPPYRLSGTFTGFY